MYGSLRCVDADCVDADGYWGWHKWYKHRRLIILVGCLDK